MVIHKYVLPNGPAVACLQIPVGAQFLRVDSQHNLPVIWFLVEPNAPTEAKAFAVVMTGQNFTPGGTGPGSLCYKGTAQLHGGSFVLHVFEVRR